MVAADARLAVADLQGGNHVADAFRQPVGKRPGARVYERVRVLVGGGAQVAARQGGHHDVVAALRADEISSRSGTQAVEFVLLFGGEADHAHFALRAR